ncbi:molecular chaperone HtpG [Cryomorphaceae bacterium]|nr:molecular chaperone HtpG [Cryomorphaceae bacterium]
MAKGKINVQSENIFPIIKKFLYSDHEIFVRELISNAVDATQKLQTLARLGEFNGEIGETRIEVSIDKEAKTLTFKDRGLGMTGEEVKKYINQVAFSGAKEFMSQYEGQMDGAGIIGNFGLGFYSSFMVSDKVEINTKSFKEGEGTEAVRWECEGDPEYRLTKSKKEERGSEIILHISEDSEEFLEESRIREILNKYCKFLPVEIQFGTKEVTEGEGDDAVTEVVPDIINNPAPAWTKAPSSLEEEDYKNFYRELYPMQFDEPLFHIHLNVDYPFNLTGVLFFPKIKNNIEVQKDKIQLYSNQVFVTDSVEGIVPDFLTLLQGVIDSPDIPLNVSRSYLQSDSNVKKISSHITKKVADKLEELFKNDRERLESIWEDIKVIIEYGMLSEEKFFEKAKKFNLYPNVEGKHFTFEEYTEKVKDAQTDKDGKLVILYTNNPEEQHGFIEEAKGFGYDVLNLDSPIVGHLLQRLEMDGDKVSFARVDSDPIEKLIAKDDEHPSKLSEEEKEALKPVIEAALQGAEFTVALEAQSEKSPAFSITQPEFMRRMKEMSMTGGGMMGMGNLPDSFNLIVNVNHPLVGRIQGESDENKRTALINQGVDLAKLSQNMLKGEALTSFIKRSYDLIDA